MNELRDVVNRAVPAVSRPNVMRAFRSDDDVVLDYFESVYGRHAAHALTGRDTMGLPTVQEALLFPVRTGMDPQNPETAEWAKFACERILWNEETGRHDTRTRFPDADDVFLLLDAGIPLTYAEVVTAPWGEYPTDAVMAAWRSGVPQDYLGATL